MTVQFSDTVRNAVVDSIESTIGASPKLEIRTGAQPANCSAVATGTLLAEIPCPADWLSNAAAGVKTLAGLWTANAIAAGTAAHYRIADTTGAVCHEQGSITITGAGGDLTLDNTNIAIGQAVTITAKTLTAAGA